MIRDSLQITYISFKVVKHQIYQIILFLLLDHFSFIDKLANAIDASFILIEFVLTFEKCLKINLVSIK